MWLVSEEDGHALEATWLAFMITRGGGMDRIAKWWRVVWKHYSEPHRQYHTLAHIRDMLSLVTGEAAVAATWFHDIVYDPTRADNEDASAKLAATALRELGFGTPGIDVVAQMIRATTTHDRNDLPQQALIFVDADVAVLGSPHDRYVAYRDAVRREYASLSDDEFVRGRRVVIERFLSRPQIYFTQTMREKFEAQARANLLWELSGAAPRFRPPASR